MRVDERNMLQKFMCLKINEIKRKDEKKIMVNDKNVKIYMFEDKWKKKKRKKSKKNVEERENSLMREKMKKRKFNEGK